MLKKEVTIYDLAQKLHLSTSTISAALNDDPAVNHNTRKTILKTAQELVPERPDGIFTTNDFLAPVCMQKLKEHSIRVTQDTVIVGLNNDVISKLTEPRLTTNCYPGEKAGELAACSVLDHLAGISPGNPVKKLRAVPS